jgi:hypothetical protein
MKNLIKNIIAFVFIAGISSAVGQQITGGGGGGGGGTPGGSNTQVQFNNSGAFGADSGFTYAGTGQVTHALGTITTDNHAIAITATFNNAGTTFDAPFRMDVTDTASNSNSFLADFYVGGSRVAGIQKNGQIITGGSNNQGISFGSGAGNQIYMQTGIMKFFNGGSEVLDLNAASASSPFEMQARSFVAGGSTPTATGTCPINTQLGGNTAGSFKANGACASGTVILTFAFTATNGWACDAHDLTTTADLMNQTAYTTTTATFTGTMANADLVTFKCRAF